MSPDALKLFLTGNPGSGKTTLVRRVIESLGEGVPVKGFLTEEIRDREGRRGFQGRTIDGQTFVLAHVDSDSETRVGAYGVERDGLERVGVPSLSPAPDTKLVVVDEVGKMEAFSGGFRKAVHDLLDSPVPVLGTVAPHGVGFVKKVRKDPRVTLLRVGRGSRDAMVDDVRRRLAKAGVGIDPAEDKLKRLRHDTNNLLMGLMGHLELLRLTEGLPEKAARHADEALVQAERIRELLESLKRRRAEPKATAITEENR